MCIYNKSAIQIKLTRFTILDVGAIFDNVRTIPFTILDVDDRWDRSHKEQFKVRIRLKSINVTQFLVNLKQGDIT